MHAATKYSEKALSIAANGAWFMFKRANRFRPNPSFTPDWSDKPLLKSWEKTKPPLVWPRRRLDDRPHQSLQHDVRSLLHGRESDWLCARTDLGRYHAVTRQRDFDQTAPPAFRPVLWWRANAVSIFY